MWVIKYLPEWIFHAFIIIGAFGMIATYLVKLIPVIYRYVIPIQIISVAFLIFGIYFSGVAANEAKWEQKAKEYKHEIFLAEERARSTASKIEYVFLDRVQQVKDVQVVVQEKLGDIKISIDSMCKVSPEAIELVNSAAKNTMPADSKTGAKK